MQPIKVLVLAALAALTAMAFVGAGPALAESTALCTEDTEACPEAKRISHVHEATLEGKKATLLGAVEVKCDVLFLGDVTSANNLGSSLGISGNFTYTNCVRENGKTCEVKETSSSSSISVLKSGHELAAVSYAYEVNFHCGLLINCTYDGEGLTGHVLGPLLSEAANGETRIEKQVTHRVSGICPETEELDILTAPLEIEVTVKLKTYISA